jgi:hypothetical protein
MHTRIHGRLTLSVLSPEGCIIARRCASNLVLRKGAGIIANLFAGVPGSVPINQIQVGFGTDTGSPELTALTPPAGGIPIASVRSPLTPAAFQIATDKPGSIQVSVTAVFKPAIDLPDVTEAGLLAGEVLYNQVVFEPITMRAGQSITFFWEIDFPFGQ